MEREQPSPVNCRIPIVMMFIVWSLINYPSNVHSQEQPNTITFINQSGEPALVKLIGPTSLPVEVPNGTSRRVNVSAGEYYELVRYGSKPDYYTYSKGKPFTVEQTETQYSEISITLHKVVGGNYPTHPISEKEFDDTLIAQKSSDKKMPSSKGVTNISDPQSQTQLLPWALNRFFALMNENPSKLDAARMRLQQDLDGKHVEIPLVMKPSSDLYEIKQSPPESFFAGVNEGKDFAILYPNWTFKASSGERVSDIDKDAFEKAATLLTGKAYVVWSGKDAKPNNSAYEIILIQKKSGASATVLVQIYIADAISREASQKDRSIDAVTVEDKSQEDTNYEKAEEYNNQGLTYVKEKEYDKAIAEFNKAIDINPKYTEAYANRAFSYDKKGDYDRAISELNKAIEIDPEYFEAYLGLGSIYLYGKNDIDRAIAEFNKAIEINRNAIGAYASRGVGYHKKGDTQKACSDWKKVCELGECSMYDVSICK